MVDSFGWRFAGAMLAGALALAGCGGSSGGDDVTVQVDPPAKPVFQLAGGFKALTFAWTGGTGATAFNLKADLSGSGTFETVQAAIPGDQTGAALEIVVHDFDWANAVFKVEGCNEGGCVESDPVAALPAMAAAIGYAKASNTGESDHFGAAVALSADGSTLAIGAPDEDSAATGVGGNEGESCTGTVTNCATDAGAVYVYVRSAENAWVKQAYVKASNAQAGDRFGTSVALSADGNTLVVGAPFEDGGATTVGGDETSNTAGDAGAVYVYVRQTTDGATAWSKQAYLKADTRGDNRLGFSVAVSADGNTVAAGAPGTDLYSGAWRYDVGRAHVFVRAGTAWSLQSSLRNDTYWGAFDLYGWSVAVSGTGDTAAVGMPQEDSAAVGIGGSTSDSTLTPSSGAVHLWRRNGTAWDLAAYVKASNTGGNDRFGEAVALDYGGVTLAVGAPGEASYGTGVGADQTNNTGDGAGAVYVFAKASGLWSQQVYVKPSNTGAADAFGSAVALSSDGSALLVGAPGEDGGTVGVDGDQTSEAADGAGAAYLFTRSVAKWTQANYLKASNTGAGDAFGSAAAIGLDGDVLALGARMESGTGTLTTTPFWDEGSDTALYAGAVYVY